MNTVVSELDQRSIRGGAASYTIRRVVDAPSLDDHWLADSWAKADLLGVDHFHSRSGTHRPSTQVKVLYDPAGLYLFFHVNDRYVQCVQTEYQSRVSLDSCVEFFVRPHRDRGYFSFEMNCGGTLLLYYVEDWTRLPGNEKLFRRYTVVPQELGGLVRIQTSLPRTVSPEIQSPVNWSLRAFIPFTLFEHYLGPLGDVAGQQWTGNFFKCGDATSHPHWASWSRLGETLRFHDPTYFGKLLFAD